MVITKSGRVEPVSMDRIQNRLEFIRTGLGLNLPELDSDTIAVAIKTVSGIYNGVTTTELDSLSEKTFANSVFDHYHNDSMAARLRVSALHNSTGTDLTELYGLNSTLSREAVLNQEFSTAATVFGTVLGDLLDYDQDYRFDFMGIETLSNGYLLKLNGPYQLKPGHVFHDVQMELNTAGNDNTSAREKIHSRLRLFDIYAGATPAEQAAVVDKIARTVCYQPHPDMVLRDKSHDRIVERPQQLFMRVAMQTHIRTAMESIQNGMLGLSSEMINRLLLKIAQLYPEIAMETDAVTNLAPAGTFAAGTTAINEASLRFLVRTPDRVLKLVMAALDLPDVLSHIIASTLLSEPGRAYIELCRASYRAMSTQQIIAATPTLFNSGLTITQLASCFLTYCGDSIEAITETFSEAAKISKFSGGVGVCMSDVRASGSYIRQTGGYSDGIVPFMKILNHTMRAFNQGGGKRKGAAVVYIEPWHADIEEFLLCRTLKQTKPDLQCYDLFLGLFIPDLFMEALAADRDWYLMCPHECPGLTDSYGDEFNRRYQGYVDAGRFRRKTPARVIWQQIADVLIERGMPYLLFKDACNRTNNQINLGTLKQSNLCTEILEYSDQHETAVCNLGNIVLKHNLKAAIVSETRRIRPDLTDCNPDDVYVVYRQLLLRQLGLIGPEANAATTTTDTTPDMSKLDWQQFQDAIVRGFLKNVYSSAKILAISLDSIIDINRYPVEKTRRSNMRHRPIGMGVQGLADVFIMMGWGFTDPASINLNKRIFAVIYYGALETSCERATVTEPYDSYNYCKTCYEAGSIDINCGNPHHGSRISRGKYHHLDMNQATMEQVMAEDALIRDIVLDVDAAPTASPWSALHQKIQRYGVRNSLLVALAPTQTTSHIMGSVDCFEPITAVMFVKKTLANPATQIMSSHFQLDLDLLGLWSNQTRDEIILNNGEVENTSLPAFIKSVYRSIYDYKLTSIIQMDADRGRYVDQSSSNNRYCAKPDMNWVYTMAMKAWRAGLKTGCYYLRSKAGADPIKFSVDSGKQKTTTTTPALSSSMTAATAGLVSIPIASASAASSSQSVSATVSSDSVDSAKFDAKTATPEQYRDWLKRNRESAQANQDQADYVCEACQ